MVHVDDARDHVHLVLARFHVLLRRRLSRLEHFVAGFLAGVIFLLLKVSLARILLHKSSGSGWRLLLLLFAVFHISHHARLISLLLLKLLLRLAGGFLFSLLLVAVLLIKFVLSGLLGLLSILSLALGLFLLLIALAILLFGSFGLLLRLLVSNLLGKLVSLLLLVAFLLLLLQAGGFSLLILKALLLLLLLKQLSFEQFASVCLFPFFLGFADGGFAFLLRSSLLLR